MLVCQRAAESPLPWTKMRGGNLADWKGMRDEQAVKKSADAAVRDKSHFVGYRLFMMRTDLK
jgi:hypothetical protein